MKYAAETMKLLKENSAREFSIRHIINSIQPGVRGNKRNAMRTAIQRVLKYLEGMELITVKQRTMNGSNGKYQWGEQEDVDRGYGLRMPM